MRKKAHSMLNDQVPDVAQLFAEGLKMDLEQREIEARITKYFLDFDKIVDEHGLDTLRGAEAPVGETDGRERMKLRCKLLIQNILPKVAKVEIERMLEFTHREPKTDDVEHFELAVERAVRQQQYHQVQQDTKRRPEQPRGSDGEEKGAGAAKTKPTDPTKRNDKKPSAPRSGGLICKGEHWAVDCPTATDMQKEKALHAVKDKRQGHTKRVSTLGTR
ncbi:TPA: hypothetical protein N0F65_000173 [Lagenidium giganteum]|uniref:Gag protein n=1 Tax=Lagenidium giganteum TaxID=4803 RepID=A0AAV2YNK7_9STRA|nr:TPA: hypothetical protein N0F65_000173 [Lagenidium giganteum]